MILVCLCPHVVQLQIKLQDVWRKFAEDHLGAETIEEWAARL